MSDPENDSKPGRRGPKHMRLRYYTSYEEATIVKLWREHFDKITSYTENLQIFRDISFGLQQHRIRLNKQEVRRRISSYRNKYLQERGRLESDPQYVSAWRLYPLVDCLFQPKTPNAEIQTESSLIEKIEARMREEMPNLNLHHYTRHDTRTLKFDHDPDGCPFLESMPGSDEEIKAEQQPQSAQTPIVKTELKSFNETAADQPVPMGVSGEKRSPLAPANRSLESPVQAAPLQDSAYTPTGYVRRSRRRSIMPRTGQVTYAQIEQLRKENDVLEKERDANLAELAVKESEYQQLEQTFDYWLHQQETWMTFLDEHGVK